MTTTFTISEDDYVNAAQLARKVTRKLAAVYAVGVLVLVIAVIFGSTPIKAGAIGGFAAALVIILVGHNVINPMMTRRHYRNYKAIQSPVSISIEENGFTYSSANNQGFVPWDSINKWRQNEQYILVYPMPRLFHIIPTSISADGFNIAALTQALQTHVGNAQ